MLHETDALSYLLTALYIKGIIIFFYNSSGVPGRIFKLYSYEKNKALQNGRS